MNISENSTINNVPQSTDDLIASYENKMIDNIIAKSLKSLEAAFSSKDDIKTTNKNAYEIRADVLSMALDFVKWQSNNLHEPIKSDIVINVATKFYKFVENKK